MARVLIIDDDADIRESTRMVLEEIGGHTATEASDGIGGLELLRGASEPFVVLLDMLMPKLDGEGVLAAVAADAQPVTRHCYILVTASRRIDHSRPGSIHGVPVLAISKPFDINVLLDTIDSAARHLQTALKNPAT
jgi:CheY-like chemotaxis protein